MAGTQQIKSEYLALDIIAKISLIGLTIKLLLLRKIFEYAPRELYKYASIATIIILLLALYISYNGKMRIVGKLMGD